MGLQDNEKEENKIELKDLSDERKNEIGPLSIDENLNDEMLEALTIQEVGFLIYALRAHHDRTTEEIFERNIDTLYANVVKKLIDLDSIYVLFDVETRMPFVFEGEVRIFSELEFAKDIAEQYLKVHRPLEIHELPGKTNEEKALISVFEYFYLLGMEEIVVNDGRYRLDFEREEFFKTPDFSGLEEKDRPVDNPKLRFAMNDFFGELRWKVNYDGRQERLKAKEDAMVKELCEATYLIPMKMPNMDSSAMTSETPIQVPKLENEQGTCFVPCFTDWIEFMKIYDMNEWVALKGDIREAIRIGSGDSVVVNPNGENLIINEDSRKRIESYFEENK